jgi:hypothetical protein
MKRLLVLAIVAACLPGWTAPGFLETCLQKDRPKGFDSLVAINFLEGKPVPLNRTLCEKLNRSAPTIESLGLQEMLEPITLLGMFAKLRDLTITLSEETDRLSLGSLPRLHSLTIAGPLKGVRVGELTKSPHLKILSLSGTRAESSVDLNGLVAFPELTQLALADLDVKNAKSVEAAKSLETIGIKRARLDESIDWAQLPKLHYKRIE